MDIEAEKSIDVAKNAMKEGDYAKAKRFLIKSLNIQETDRARALLAQCECYLSSNSQSKPAQESSTERTKTEDSKENKRTYTDDDVKLCEDILKKTDYYAILNIPKTATEEEIKKSYRKLALKLHPDKNRAPQANEAFKKVSQSFSCLSNKEKRKIYDEHGTEQAYRQQYRRYFREEDDIDPEDLFDLFFGMGFHRRPRRRYHYQSNGQHQTQMRNQQPDVLRQLLPLLAIFILLFGMMFAGYRESGRTFKYERAFSLSKTQWYNNERRTTRAKVTYFVGEDFGSLCGDDVHKLAEAEEEVELKYLNLLQNACLKAENRRRNIQTQLYYYYNTEASKRQLQRELSRIDFGACDEYDKVYQKIRG